MGELREFAALIGKGIDVKDSKDRRLYRLLLKQAEEFVLLYTNRRADEWVSAFDSVKLRAAAALFNRLGAEGEDSVAEGSWRVSFAALSAEFAPWLDRYRVARGK